jgi:hypothetical protein
VLAARERPHTCISRPRACTPPAHTKTMPLRPYPLRRLSPLPTQVERKLRLRRLTKEGSLPDDRFRSACLRMLQHSAVLMPLLDGLPVRIAELTGLPLDKSSIDIAWDFQI